MVVELTLRNKKCFYAKYVTVFSLSLKQSDSHGCNLVHILAYDSGV